MARGGYGLGLWNDGRLFLTEAFVNNQDFYVGLVDTSSFHHVAITKSGTTIVAYLDGVAFTAPPYSSTFTFNNPVSIGALGGTEGSSFYGLIDELSVYDRALSGDEIQGIYQAAVTGKCAPPEPVITTQPMDQTNSANKNVTLSVGAYSILPLSYQWYFNTTNIPGATNSSLTLTNVQSGQAGPYTVLVSNPTNSVLSRAAMLTVIPPPPCDAAPSNIVSWWSAEGNAVDNVGGINGILTNGIAFGEAEVGQGFVLNGTNSAVQLGNPANLQLQNFTIEAWIRRFSSTASSLVTPNSSFICYGTGGYGFGLWNDGRLLLTKAGFDNVSVSVGLTDTNIFLSCCGDQKRNERDLLILMGLCVSPAPAYFFGFYLHVPGGHWSRGQRL